jgi:hypothetical protein
MLRDRSGLGRQRPPFPLFGYVAARHQYRNDDCHVLMVFLIQNTQNREGAALQAKLDELIRATRDAHNKLIALGKRPEEEVEEIREEIMDETTRSGSGRNIIP